MAEQSDDDLVRRAKADRDAMGRLYDRYYPPVYRYCVRRLFLPESAEDVAADVFLQVAKTIRQFPGETDGDFRCWVFRIATNAINAQLRQTRQCRKAPCGNGVGPPLQAPKTSSAPAQLGLRAFLALPTTLP